LSYKSRFKAYPALSKKGCTIFCSMYFVDVSKTKRFQNNLKIHSEIGK